jgi:LysM repeat protein
MTTIPRTAKDRACLAITAFAAIVFCLFGNAFSALGISGDGLIAYPTTSDPNNPLSQTWFIYNLAPGKSKEDSLTIKNNSDQQASVSLYAVDSTTNNMGEFALEEENASRDYIGKWIKLETNRLTLEPKEEKRVKFTISIPEDAAVGEISGGIIIQKDLTEAQKNTKNGFVISTRIGIRVYETVPGKTTKAASLSDANIEYDKSNKAYLYTITVKNEGNVSLESAIRLNLRGTLPYQQSRTLEQNILVPPGKAQKVIFNLDKDMIGRFEADAELKYKDTDGTEKAVTVSPVPFFAYPHDLALALGILLLLNVLFIAILRIRRIKENKYRVDYRLRPGDNLMNLAAKLGISWKKIAKLNKLKPPYQLQEGQIITLIDKKHILSPAQFTKTDIFQEPSDHYLRNRQKAFEKDLALISDNDSRFLSPKNPSKRKRTSGAVILLLIGIGSYLVYTQIALRANQAHFIYDRSMENSAKTQDNADTAPATETAETNAASGADALPAAAGSAEDSITASQRGNTRIEILNGSGIRGASARIASILREKGYASVTTGNADRFDYKTTYLHCGKEVSPAVCQEIKDIISKDYISVQSENAGNNSDADKIIIILGR